MLFTVILAEVLILAGLAASVFCDEKKLRADFDRWLSKKPQNFLYRIPLNLVVVEPKKAARHRYTQH